MNPDVIAQPRPDYYVPGGALKPTAPSYVPRAADQLLLDAVRGHQFSYVLTPRQMGKTSLMVRTAATLRREGVLSVIVDLTQIGTQVSAEEWYLGHLKRIAKELSLKTNYLDWWQKQKHLGVVQRFVTFLSDVAVDEVAQPIAIFIDEIDTTLNLGYSDDYFAAIRSLYNQRATDARLDRLTFVLLGVASPSDLIKDPKRTPFNIGTRIPLTDFSEAEATALLPGLAPTIDTAKQLLKQVLYWSGGHPYLTQKTCQTVAGWALSEKWNAKEVPFVVDELVKELFFSDAGRNTDSNLQFVRDRILENSDSGGLLKLYLRVRQSDPVMDDELDPVRVALKLSGLIKTTDDGLLKVRNLIYDRVFDDVWITTAAGKREPKGLLERIGEQLFESRKPPKKPEFQYDAYVSYGRRDRDWVKSFLVPNLEAAGVKVFVDFGGIFPGRQRALEEAFNQSRNILLIMSPDYFASEWTEVDISRSMRLLDEPQGGRRIIPVLLRHTGMPVQLARLQYVDFTVRGAQKKSMKALVTALGAPVSRTCPAPPTALSAEVLTPDSDEQYDTGAIRALLDDALDEDDLMGFVFDYFRSAYKLIDPNSGKKAKIQKLIEYADQEHELGKLLDHLAETRPKEYRRYADRLERPS